MRLAGLASDWGCSIGTVMEQLTLAELELWPHIYEARQRQERNRGRK